jgi:hypothetical protein
MKKETKRINKKVLFFSLFVLSLIAINLVLVYAADTNTGDPSFYERWIAGNFKDSQAKLLLWLMIFVVLLVLLMGLELHMGPALLISIPASFILVAYVTPASIIGVFKSYETLPLVLATFLPLAVLFAFTYLSIVKASRTLMTTQWLLWMIYFGFVVIKIALSLWVYNDNAYSEYFTQVITLPPEAESFWYWTSTVTGGIVAGIMTFGSGAFMNWAVLKTAGMEDAAAAKKFRQAKSAIKHLASIEQDLASGK